MDKQVNHLLSLKLNKFSDFFSDYDWFAIFTCNLWVCLSFVNFAFSQICHNIDELFRCLTIEFFQGPFSLLLLLAFIILHLHDRVGSII